MSRHPGGFSRRAFDLASGLRTIPEAAARAQERQYMSDTAPQLPAEVLEALQRGDKIAAIKHLRAAMGLELKEAKDIVEAHLSGKPIPWPPSVLQAPLPDSVTTALQQGNKIEAIRILRELTGLGLKEAKDAVEALSPDARSPTIRLSPAAVKDSPTIPWWLVLAAVAGLVAYYFFNQ